MFSVSVSFCCAILLTTLAEDFVKAQELNRPVTDFSRHRLVQPKVHHGRTKRQISSTKDTSGAHHSEVEIIVTVDGEQYILELQLNYNLLTEEHTVRYQRDGKTVLHKPGKKEIDFCQYHGTIRGRPSSRVALSTCHGVRGIIFDGEKTRYIEPAEGGEIQSQHYLYDHADLNTKFRCGYVGGASNNSSYEPMLMKKYNHGESLKRIARSARYKSHADVVQVRGPYNEDKQTRYVELVLVADNREFKANGEDIYTVHRQLQDIANIVNSIYSPLNIYIALVGVVVWTERDEIHIEENGDNTLTNFLNYRKTRLVDVPNDNAFLLTNKNGCN